MGKLKDSIKILLLQIREDELTKEEERDEFIRFSQLRSEQVDCINAFEYCDFSPDIIEGYDGLFIGGSSDATVRDPIKYPFIPSCKKLIRYCYDIDLPVLASCFGFQLAAEEFGGKVELDPDNMEMGLYPIELTIEAKQDLLLSKFDSKFWAVSGHKERATQLPKDAINLGHTQLCPYHIFTFPNKPFYAFQFHPEVDTADLIKRISRYQERYLDCDNALDEIIKSSVHNTDESNSLITEFVNVVILGNK